jgi:hypothetical protein
LQLERFLPALKKSLVFDLIDVLAQNGYTVKVTRYANGDGVRLWGLVISKGMDLVYYTDTDDLFSALERLVEDGDKVKKSSQ